MMNLFERRKKSGMSQFLCAQRSGIPRMRLSLAETGQIALSPKEEAALRQALTEYISAKAHEIALLSQERVGSTERDSRSQDSVPTTETHLNAGLFFGRWVRTGGAMTMGAEAR